MKSLLTFIICCSLLFIPLSSKAIEPVKIGMITTLSTNAGYLGEEIRDGFKLALDLQQGKLGGIPVELLVEDDGLKPEKGRQIADRFIKKDKIKILTGSVFSNVALAVVPKVVKQGVFYISPNAGPSRLAGKGCEKNFFNLSWQIDTLAEGIGQYATEQGYSNVYILAPNYIAGKDNVTGFKRFYKGKVVAEVYVTLGQADYAAEIADLRAAKPDAVFFFLPGGMGLNFLKQYAQAGMSRTIPLMGPAATDECMLKAVGKAAIGVINSSQWNIDFDTPENKKFVTAYQKAYNRNPTLFASQGYDTAMLIGSALAAVQGDMSKTDEFRAALEKADFQSLRGNFKFGHNHFPIQDFYVREVYEREDGSLGNKILRKVFTDHQDVYAAECKSNQ